MHFEGGSTWQSGLDVSQVLHETNQESSVLPAEVNMARFQKQKSLPGKERSTLPECDIPGRLWPSVSTSSYMKILTLCRVTAFYCCDFFTRPSTGWDFHSSSRSYGVKSVQFWTISWAYLVDGRNSRLDEEVLWLVEGENSSVIRELSYRRWWWCTLANEVHLIAYSSDQID